MLTFLTENEMAEFNEIHCSSFINQIQETSTNQMSAYSQAQECTDNDLVNREIVFTDDRILQIATK